jgi:hypothetical protein
MSARWRTRVPMLVLNAVGSVLLAGCHVGHEVTPLSQPASVGVTPESYPEYCSGDAMQRSPEVCITYNATSGDIIARASISRAAPNACIEAEERITADGVLIAVSGLRRVCTAAWWETHASVGPGSATTASICAVAIEDGVAALSACHRFAAPSSPTPSCAITLPALPVQIHDGRGGMGQPCVGSAN